MARSAIFEVRLAYSSNIVTSHFQLGVDGNICVSKRGASDIGAV